MGDIVDIVNGGCDVKRLRHYPPQVLQLDRLQVAQEEELVVVVEEVPSLEEMTKVENIFLASCPHLGQVTFSPTLDKVVNFSPQLSQTNS